MDHDPKALEHDRKTLYGALTRAGDSVTLRALIDFHPLDSSVLYASNGSRALVVSVIENVSWSPEPSSYVEDADDFRSVPIMMIDVPNALDGQIEAVRSLFLAWFAADPSPTSA